MRVRFLVVAVILSVVPVFGSATQEQARAQWCSDPDLSLSTEFWGEGASHEWWEENRNPLYNALFLELGFSYDFEAASFFLRQLPNWRATPPPFETNVVSGSAKKLMDYFSSKASNPSWGHIEWVQAALPWASSIMPDFPNSFEPNCSLDRSFGPGGLASSSCWEIYINVDALNFINETRMSFGDVLDLGEEISNTLLHCLNSWPDIRPSQRAGLWGTERVTKTQICQSSVYFGKVRLDHSKEEIGTFIQEFWLDRLPIANEARDTFLAANKLIQITQVATYDTIADLERHFVNPHSWHRHQRQNQDRTHFVAVTMNFLDLQTPVPGSFGSSLVFVEPIGLRDFELTHNRVRGRVRPDNIYHCTTPAGDGMRIIPTSTRLDVTLVFVLDNDMEPSGLRLELPSVHLNVPIGSLFENSRTVDVGE